MEPPGSVPSEEPRTAPSHSAKVQSPKPILTGDVVLLVIRILEP